MPHASATESVLCQGFVGVCQGLLAPYPMRRPVEPLGSSPSAATLTPLHIPAMDVTHRGQVLGEVCHGLCHVLGQGGPHAINNCVPQASRLVILWHSYILCVVLPVRHELQLRPAQNGGVTKHGKDPAGLAAASNSERTRRLSQHAGNNVSGLALLVVGPHSMPGQALAHKRQAYKRQGPQACSAADGASVACQ